MDAKYHPHPPLSVVICGQYACFTRPELKSERVSYPVMTPSAAKGVLEAIYWKPEFDYVVSAIEVLKPIKWASIRRNEVTSMASPDWVRRAMADATLRFDVEGDRDQRNTVFLRDVAYRIRAQVRPRPHAGGPEAAYREQFRRRVDRGACFNQPFLGTRECSASFSKDSGQPAEDITEDLGLMLHTINYGPRGETYTWFEARLENGVLQVPESGRELVSAPVQARGGA